MSRKILIIDDDEDDCELFIDAARLVDADLEIEKIFTSPDAIGLLKTGYRPDFIFLDLNMPMIDGNTCLKEIRGMNSLTRIPVIIYSTSKRKNDESRLSMMGADYFLTKPSSLRELCEEISYILAAEWRVPVENV
jgi:CheY-like chemotaxis protein